MLKPRALNSAEVAHPDQRGAPFAVNAKGSFDGGDEAGYVVPYATHTEFAKIGKVLAHLRCVHVARFSERAGGDDLHAVALYNAGVIPGRLAVSVGNLELQRIFLIHQNRGL